MADVRQLEDDVRYWADKIRTIQDDLRNATQKLETRQRDLKIAIDDEARRNENK